MNIDDYDYISPSDYGWIHEDDLPDIAHCEDMIKGIIEAVYESGDVSKLETCLDELTHQFGMNIPKNMPILERKEIVRQDRTIESWLQFNQGYNDYLRNQAIR